jgi:hypothetical protein
LYKKIEGTIVESRVNEINNTELYQGIIIIKTDEGDLVRIDVGSYTIFDTLVENSRVVVEADYFEATGELYATKIIFA